MAEDQPGPPGSGNHDDRLGQQPTEPLGGPTQRPAPPFASGRPGSDPRSRAPTAPLPGDQPAPPAFAAASPPREALAGFWRRLASAFLDWLLVGIVAAAIGELFGVQAPSPPSADGDGVNVQVAGTGPFILVELAYFTYFHATSAGQSIGNKILGIRVLDANTGRSLPYARAFVRALMSNLSALPCFLGFFWMLWEPPQADLARHRRRQPGRADHLLPTRRIRPPRPLRRPLGGRTNGDGSRTCVSRAPSPLERLNRALPSPCTTQLKDTIPERWIQAKSPTKEGRGHPSVIVPGRKA